MIPEAWITHDPQKLFTETFRNNYKAGRDSILQGAMVENDLWNWKPASKVVLCHGDRDDYVPLFNSEKAYKRDESFGGECFVKSFQRATTHSSGALNFVQQAYTTFEDAK